MKTAYRMVFVIAAAVALRGALGAAERPPNLVFILVDDWGWTDAACYGSTFYETPQIDRLAADGMRFTQAYSACTVCSPSRAAILTGKTPARLHVTDWIPGYSPPDVPLRAPDWRKYLPLDERTIAEVLRERGYATAMIGKWHLGAAAYAPEKQGFDVNFSGTHVGSPRSFFPPYGLPGIAKENPGEMLSDRLTAEAIAFIAAQQARPFFLYLSHYAVHTPIAGKPEVVEKYQRKLATGTFTHDNPIYAALVESVDDSVGAIRATLERLGLADNTIIVLTSDNGGLAGRHHAGNDQTGPTTNFPLRMGKGSAYEGGVRVPLIIRWPGVTSAGRVTDTVVGGIDLFPTFEAMVGAPVTPIPVIDGKSFAAVLRGEESPAESRQFWHYPHYHPGGASPYSAVRDGAWKLVHFYEDGHDELYNLSRDSGETHDLSTASGRTAARLRGELDHWLEETRAQMPVRVAHP